MPTPFDPHPFLRSGHAQTIAGWALKRRIVLPAPEDRLFNVAHGVQVLCRIHWQEEKIHRGEGSRGGNQHGSIQKSKVKSQNFLTLILIHGLEGSSESKYILGTASNAFAAGMNVVRMNIRNCGGTERLSRTLYHSGLSEDIAAVASVLGEDRRVDGIVLAGFSLGGNQVLKLAGEWRDSPPPYVRAVAAVSPAMDLDASCDLLHAHRNRIYEWHFLRSLKQRVRLKRKLFPESAAHIEPGDAIGEPEVVSARKTSIDLSRIRSMREFDDRITAPAFNFAGAADYYVRASASPGLTRIAVPTLAIYALDDPFICVLPETRDRLQSNPNITVLKCEHGGHCGFIAADGKRWAEEQVVNFFMDRVIR